MFHAAPQLILAPWNYWWVVDDGHHDEGDDDGDDGDVDGDVDGDDRDVDGNDDGDEYNQHNFLCCSHSSWLLQSLQLHW